MSSNDTITDYEEAAKAAARRFADILKSLSEGKDLSNEDAIFIVQLVGDLDNNLRIANEIVDGLAISIPDMARSLGFAVLARAGRGDQKIKKSVLKICDEHVETLWTMARIQALQSAADIAENQETTEEVPS
jgi:hypothetical protein